MIPESLLAGKNVFSAAKTVPEQIPLRDVVVHLRVSSRGLSVILFFRR